MKRLDDSASRLWRRILGDGLYGRLDNRLYWPVQARLYERLYMRVLTRSL